MAYKMVFLVLILVAVVTFLYTYKTMIIFTYTWPPISTLETGDVIITAANNEPNTNITGANSKSTLKYILQWTSPTSSPFVYMKKEQEIFFDRNCTYTNCFVTGNKSYLGDYTKFDVIAFAGSEVTNLHSLPERRSAHQKYAFATIESADNYPICSHRLDGFFNWTWTYRLESEVRWGYITVRDKDNNIVGPNEVMHWKKIEDMDPVSPELRAELGTKSKAAAWFVSNCLTRSKRENFVKELQIELKKYNLEVDIYGRCGNMKCSRKREKECNEKIKTDYYFYLSFENSFSEDYVTEKLLHALEFNAVPVVYGGANYTRFMPDGIYLNARELGPARLALKMHELINDPEQYIQYFKWRNHYSYHRKLQSLETDQYCLFCSWLNNEHLMKKQTIYKNFREWWDPPNRC